MEKNTLDYMVVWDDMMSLLKQHKQATIAIAGVFVFFPAWLVLYFIGIPPKIDFNNIEDFILKSEVYFVDNWIALLLSDILRFIGILSLGLLLIKHYVESTGHVILESIKLLVTFILIYIIFAFLFSFLIFLFVPVLYLIGRFLPILGVITNERSQGVFGCIKRSWNFTRGLGWMAFLMFIIIYVVANVVSLVIELFGGLIFNLIGSNVGVLLASGLSSLLASVVTVLISTLSIAIYRHLKPQVDGAVTSASE